MGSLDPLVRQDFRESLVFQEPREVMDDQGPQDRKDRRETRGILV